MPSYHRAIIRTTDIKNLLLWYQMLIITKFLQVMDHDKFIGHERHVICCPKSFLLMSPNSNKWYAKLGSRYSWKLPLAHDRFRCRTLNHSTKKFLTKSEIFQLCQQMNIPICHAVKKHTLSKDIWACEPQLVSSGQISENINHKSLSYSLENGSYIRLGSANNNLDISRV